MIQVLVTGANGQLGSEIKLISEETSIYKFYFTDYNELDITNKTAVENFVNKHAIHIIINCAAYTNVDKAEDEWELSNSINHKAVENLATISKEKSIKLIHISTDYVFDGESETPYLETATTNPINNYGLSKLKGEEALLKINPKNSIIIRTSWLYSVFGSNFVKTMLRLFKEKDVLNVVSDQVGSPTNAKDLSSAIFNIIPNLNNDRVEIFHYSNTGTCSWFQFAKEILAFSNETCDIKPVSSKEFKTKAKRPKFSILDTHKIEKVFNIQIPSWEESLHNCLIKINTK